MLKPTADAWSEAKLVEFCLSYRSALLGDESSSRMCVAVSAPLKPLLELHGQHCELVEVSTTEFQHCFLKLRNGLVLDATADQFSGMPPVYLGLETALHRGAQTAQELDMWASLAREFLRLNEGGCPKEYGRLVGLALRTLPEGLIEFSSEELR